jgi:DNA-binding MarR family transcriptional regulator
MGHPSVEDDRRGNPSPRTSASRRYESRRFEPASKYRVTIYRLQTIAARYNRRMKRLALSDYQALAEFRFQIRKFLHFSEKAVQASGLAIKGIPEGVRPRIRELANRMQIQHHSAVELVNRLEAGGFVRRERAQEDRREVLLALTPKGEKVLAELALHHHEELQSAAPALVAALRRVMRDGKEA